MGLLTNISEIGAEITHPISLTIILVSNYGMWALVLMGGVEYNFERFCNL